MRRQAGEIELEVLGRGNKGLRIEGHENEKMGEKILSTIHVVSLMTSIIILRSHKAGKRLESD